MNPTDVRKRLKKANKRWWMLEKVAKRLDAKHKNFENKVLPAMPKEMAQKLKQKAMQVF